ncbi:Caudovirus prohead protease [Planctomycetes bacterium Poly30]|uniref:Caudovirus prohead protease n=1 Tax=Saltatorellus ferox TaxID=2528018 RepID=A0A518EKY1_9BACT|nr:Caudovirus prohead protease [Planctomycetes bacterium Poly30]
MSEAIVKDRVDVASIEMRVVPASYNEVDRTFEIVFSTGAAVRRYSWRFGGYYDELLSLDPAHVRLERLNTGRAPFLQDHDSWTVEKVIGSIVAGSVRVEDGKMIGRVQMHQTERALELTERMARGELCSVSLGYQTYEHLLVERDGEIDQRTATDWEPYELSLVSIPADNDSHTRNQPRGAECVVRTNTETIMSGTTGTKVKAPKATTSKRKTDEGSEPEGSHGDDGTTPEAGETRNQPEPSTSREEAAAKAAGAREERARASEIRMHVKRAGLKESVAERLIKEGKSVLEAREAIIDEWFDENRGEEIHSTVGVETEERDKVKGAMARALLNRHDPRRYKLEEGDDARQFGGDSLLDLGVRYVSRIGEKLPEVGNKMVRAGLILGQRIGGMHVSSDFSHILANVAGRTLQDSYREAPRAFEPLVRMRAVADFKPVSVTKLGPASDLDEVKEGAEYSRATIDDTGDTYKLLKYGKVIAISREAIINDDLDAFSRIWD